MIKNYIGKLDDAEYRARQRGDTPAIGGSGLVLIERASAAHHTANQARMRTSAPGAHGTLIHCLALEPDTFAHRYAIRPDVVERFDVPEPRRVIAPELVKTEEGWSVEGHGHECRACSGQGCTAHEIPDFITKECTECSGAGLVGAVFATQAKAKAHRATVSGWTVDGFTFFATKKALEKTGACHRWALAGSVECGPWYRVRDDATAHAATLAGDRIPVSVADYERATDAADALTAHPVAGRLLDDADATELSVLWHDLANGIDCSGQLDAYLANTDGIDLEGLCIEPGRRVGVDLKTTAKLLDPAHDARRILDGGHHIQAAHYMAGCAANGQPLDAWIMIYVETVAPYGVRVVQLGEQFLALGRYRRDRALAKVLAWQALGADAMPPSYAPRCITVEPPAYAVPDAVGDVVWSDWIAEGASAGRDALVAAARAEHCAAEDDVERIEAALGGLIAGRAELARSSVAHALDGEYGAALAESDGMTAIGTQIEAARVEHASAEICVAKAWAKLQGVRHG